MKHAKDNVSRKLYRYRLTQDQKGHTGKGRKFVPSLELESLEGKLATKDLIGNAQTGTSGLGLRKKPPSTFKSRRRELITMKDEIEHKRMISLQKLSFYTNVQHDW